MTLLALEQAPTRFKVATEIAGLVDFLAYMAYMPEYRRHSLTTINVQMGYRLKENAAVASAPVRRKVRNPKGRSGQVPRAGHYPDLKVGRVRSFRAGGC